MKPLNLDNRPCSPISSNCVIWQGPDIPCIKLCNGDTVSDVVFSLATELCAIMDQLKVSNYDLTCLGITACPPEDFQALIQLLIDKICESNGITPDPEKSSGCPDCVVSVAPCFVEGTQTTMQLIDYVQMIANRICSILDEIGIINNQITSLDNRVTILENTPPPSFTLPSIPADCILAPGSYPIDQVLNALMNDDTLGYCTLLGATGNPSDITGAVLSQCINDTSLSLASESDGDSPVQTFAQYYMGTWIDNATLTTFPTVANAINNIWIAICDMYNYLSNLTPSVTVVEGGEGITVTSATVGSTTTYTVNNDYLETFNAYLSISYRYAPECGIINSIFPGNVTTPGSPTYGGEPSDYKGITEGMPIFKYTSVSSNSNYVGVPFGPGNYILNSCLPELTFGCFDNETGVFTITEAGTYLMKATIHLKPDSADTQFWSGSTFEDLGSFILGITVNNATDMHVAQGQTLVPGIDRNVEISVSKIITVNTNGSCVPVPTGTTLRVKVLNTTNRNYDGTAYIGGDFINFSIVKLRNNIVSTTCSIS